MATRVLNQDKVVELLRKYRPNLLIEKVAGGTMTIKFLCPYHTEENPSFVFAPSKNQGHCFACNTRGDLASVIKEFEQISMEKAAKIAAICFERVVNENVKKKGNLNGTSFAQLIQWHEQLETETKLTSRMKTWGWSKEITIKYMLGNSDGRLVIPMIEDESIVGIKYYSPGGNPKYQNMEGSASVCWPLENLAQSMVYLVEGEKDCLTMLSQGLNAVTFTTGAGKIAGDYIRYFAGKEVNIIYDTDEAGRKGAVSVANSLGFAAKQIKIIDLPLNGKPKGDLTDFYVEKTVDFVEEIRLLTQNSDIYQTPAAINRVEVDPNIYRTYLEDIVKSKLFYKRVSLKVRIVNKSLHETTVVPKEVRVSCNKDFKEHVCAGCPLGFKTDGINLFIRPDYAEIMSMVGNNNKVQREAIRSMIPLPEGCPKFKIEQKSHQSLYPIVLIPAIEADKKSHDYSMVTAWALDVPSKENEDYDVEAVVLANPETQKMELICYKMNEDVTSIDSFELTEEMIKNLGVFQCQ